MPTRFSCHYKKICGLCVVLLCTVFCLGSVAESVEPSDKKVRIGLVLGGGGARGAAHMGVIQVLEELKIPVDIIVGTSMGAIVGGFYASGFSTEELEAMIYMDWDTAFQDAPPLEKLPFRRKQELKRYVFSNKVGMRGGKIQIPPGLIQGQTQIMALKKLALPMYKIRDFDDLKIPFRSVATDIADFKQVALGKGDLATAIRASMTVPGVFAPVQLDGRILVDGGLVNNVPADVAEQMGADILIIVDVGTQYADREDLSSVTGVANQLSTYLVRENTDEQFVRLKAGEIDAKPIIIRPDLGDLSSADFKNADEAIAKGRDAALKLSEELKALSVSSDEFELWLKKQRRKPFTPPIINYIDVKNNSEINTSVVRKCFRISPGDTLNIEELEEDISNLYGMGYFERIEYSLLDNSGRTGLVLDVVGKSWGPDYLSFGFNLSDDFNGNSNYNIRANYTKTCINKLGAEWRNEIMFGEPSGFFTEFYQPLNHPVGFFISPSFRYTDRKIGVFSSGDEVASYRSRSRKTRLDVGYSIGSYGEIRTGGVYNRGKFRLSIGDPGFPSNDYVRSGWSTVFNYDKTDRTSFIRYGSKARIEFESDMESMGSDQSVNTLDFHWSGARTWGRYSLVPGLRFNSTLGDDNSPAQYQSFAGGFLNLSGYTQDELVGSHTGVARLVLYRRIGKSDKRPFYIGCSAETGNAWNHHDDISFDSLLASGSVFIGKDTFLGHFYLGAGFAESGRNSFYFSLGQMY